MKRACPAVLAACLCAVSALPGCKPSTTNAPHPAASTATAGPSEGAAASKPGIALRDLRIILPRVSDRPAALYFLLSNTGTARATLVGVYVDGATKTDMHETVGDTMKPLTKLVIEPGATVVFAPGGKHVMLYGIPGTWKPSDAPAVTLKFADADKVWGKAVVQKAQGPEAVSSAGADMMPGMKM